MSIPMTNQGNKGDKPRAEHKYAYPPSTNTDTFSWNLHILPIHFHHLSDVTGLCLCVNIALTKACHSKQTQQRSGSLEHKDNMVPLTSLLHTTSLSLPLCLLYPSHPRAFPNQHSFPSISPAPKPSSIVSPQTHIPN